MSLRVAFLASAIGMPGPGNAVEAPALASDAPVAEAGTYRLHWTGDGRSVELQQADTQAFATPRTLYRGTDAARVISGRPDGVSYFRIRYLEPPGPWSATVRVEVRHHDLAEALGLFGVGALVFLSTATLIVVGGRRRRRDQRD